MYIPDLFGAYVKGRELAIEKNWQDLKNFESIEAARNQNDLNAMDIWERRQQMPGKTNMFYNNVDTSQMNTDVAREANTGLIAKARMGSGHAQDQLSVWQANRDYGREVMNRGYQTGLTMMDAAGINKAGQANYWLTDNRAYQHGGNVAQQVYDTQRGNSTTAAHYPTVAQQQNREGDAAHGLNMVNYNYQTDYMRGRHGLLPDELKLQGLHAKNDIYTAEGFIPNQTADKTAQRNQQLLSLLQEQSSLYDKLSTVTDPATRQVLQSQIAYLQDYMYGMGYTPDTTIPSGAGISSQATPTVNPPQTYMPVGTNSVLAPAPQTNQPVQDIRTLQDIHALLPPVLQNPNGNQVYNYPISPESGQYRPIMPAPTPQEVQQQQTIDRLLRPRLSAVL